MDFLFRVYSQELQEAGLENLGTSEMRRLTDLSLKLIKFLSDLKRYCI